MAFPGQLLDDVISVYQAAKASDDGRRCMVAPSPELREKIKKELSAAHGRRDSVLGALSIRAAEPRRDGFNDGMIFPPEEFPFGTSPSLIRNAAAERAPLRGVVRVIVVLVDFSDRQMAANQQHFRDLFFSNGVVATQSVREYFAEATHGLIDIRGDVVGPFRMPLTLAQYAHGAAGIGDTLPNARTMARDAANAANASVNFAPFDNDGNGFVDAFIVIHAGSGGEVTGNSNDIWSHKWVVDGGAMNLDGTKIFAYLTVPEDARIGVCAHEIGHLAFGFPDLYDTDNSSEGIGNWCLMAGGSWGGGGDTPCHPSAWCKANQGWVAVDNRTSNGMLSIQDVKDSNTVYRLWKDGAPGNEYFLVENRQKNRFDASLPGSGLLVWHIDEAVAGNTNELHPKVALMQADGKKELESAANRGNDGDCYPGSSGNTSFNNTSNPHSKSYSNTSTCVAVTGISPAGPVMTANLAVKCRRIKVRVEKPISEKIDKLPREKPIADKRIEKPISEKPISEKRPEKPVTDKTAGFDKGQIENKVTDGGFRMPTALTELEARVAMLEAALSQALAAPSGRSPEPFIASDLRPDLSQGALMGENDYSEIQQQMQAGSAEAKRSFDTKQSES